MELDNFRYRNQFNITGKLTQSLSKIISAKENGHYICGIIGFNTEAHKEIVYETREHGIIMPTLSSFGYIEKCHGEYKEETIESKPYSYFAVIDKETYKFFSRITSAFSKQKDMENVLNILCPFHQEYEGVLNSSELVERYPYLQEFFDHIDTWRMENNRATIDDEVITAATEKVLPKKEYKKQ